MAQGTSLLFQETSKYIGDGSHDMDNDTFSVILITTLPLVVDISPDRSDYTEVTAGGGYTAGGITLTTPTWTEAGGVTTLDDTDAFKLWTSAGAGDPANVVAALLVNDTHAGTNDALAFIDLTTDAGVTPISLLTGDIKITWGGAGVFTITA